MSLVVLSRGPPEIYRPCASPPSLNPRLDQHVQGPAPRQTRNKARITYKAGIASLFPTLCEGMYWRHGEFLWAQTKCLSWI